MSCISCNEEITNPICVKCIGRGISDWLEKKDFSLKNKVEVLTELLFLNRGDTACIKCGNSIGLCNYCYTEEVGDWLKREVPELEKRFREYFNYHLKQKKDLLKKEKVTV